MLCGRGSAEESLWRKRSYTVSWGLFPCLTSEWDGA